MIRARTATGRNAHQGQRPSSSTEHAALVIREMILEGGWSPGRKLPSQRELALRLGISRPTVREALIVMETRGEVETLPGKGVYLAGTPEAMDQDTRTAGPAPRKPSMDDSGMTAGKAAQMYQFRYAIEPAVAKLVAVNATQAQTEDLRHLLARMREAVAAGDLAQLADLDFAFHRQMVEAANNPFFTRAIAPSLEMFFESQQLPFSTSADTGETLAEHENLLEAIRERSPDRAATAMKRHILGTARRAGVLLGLDAAENA